MVPGSIGRLASRVAFLATPLVVRRTLDLLVGGTLLAQAAVAIAPATAVGHRGNLASPALAVTSTASGASGRSVPAAPSGSGFAATRANEEPRLVGYLQGEGIDSDPLHAIEEPGRVGHHEASRHKPSQ